MFCVFWTFIERETRVFLPTIFAIYVRWLHIHRRRVCPNLFRILHNFFDCLWRRQEPREEPGRRKPGHDLWHFTEYFSIFTVHLANCRPFQPPACMQTNFYKSLGFWELFVIIVFSFSFFFVIEGGHIVQHKSTWVDPLQCCAYMLAIVIPFRIEWSAWHAFEIPQNEIKQTKSEWPWKLHSRRDKPTTYHRDRVWFLYFVFCICCCVALLALLPGILIMGQAWKSSALATSPWHLWLLPVGQLLPPVLHLCALETMERGISGVGCEVI